MKHHDFASCVIWTGNTGQGTAGFRTYQRTWNVEIPGKPVVHCSNDPLLGGDPTLMNPEDMLITALSACHMLWYLHFASDAGIVVTSYRDDPAGHGESLPDGSGRFIGATLRPRIVVQAGGDLDRANAIHGEIHKVCFIARSVNFPIRIETVFKTE